MKITSKFIYNWRKILDESKTIYHITHNDGDAVGCDVVLRAAMKEFETEYDIKTIWCSNNSVSDAIVDVYNKNDADLVIISDISPDKDSEGYKKILDWHFDFKRDDKTKLPKLIMVDHHVTNPFTNIADFDSSTIRVVNTYGEFAACDDKEPIIYDDDLHDPNKDLIGNRFDTPIADMKISATMIMYIIFNQMHLFDKMNQSLSTVFKSFVNDISRYDTWEWINHPTYNGHEDSIANVLKYISLSDLSSDILDHLYSIYTNDMDENDYGYLFEGWYKFYLPAKYITINDICIKSYDKYMEYIPNKLKVAASGEYLYGVLIGDNSVNMSVIASNIQTSIYKDIFDYILVLFPESRTLSFRTSKSTVDVSRIASRCYGGGGHVQAAGARVDIPTFNSFMTEYYTSPSMKDIIHSLELDGKQASASTVYQEWKEFTTED